MARTRPLIPDISHESAALRSVDLLPSSASKIQSQRGQMSRHTYEAIRRAILDCTLLPGMALSEQAMSDSLQVSRAPVREAFGQLATEGLLQAVPQKGSFVARLSPAKIKDAIFVREMIECRAAELAAKAPLIERKKLQKFIAQQVKASAAGDYATHLASDEAFHYQILCLAGHPHAWGSLRQARTGMNRIRHLAIPELGSNKIAIDHHRQIMQAIVAGDSKLAAKSMRLHIQSPQAFLQQIARLHPEYFEDA
ncbi:MAG: GntR family transcriptional regulator [Brachymonas sp.]|nr:GntR family transcriptional regulator [Brachymonas sp.]